MATGVIAAMTRTTPDVYRRAPSARNRRTSSLRSAGLRRGLAAKTPEVTLEGEVERDEVYVVAGHLPICVQKPLAALGRAPVSSTEIQDDLANPARSTSCASSRKSSWCSVSSRCTSRLEIDTPTDCSSAVTRGSVD